MRHTLNVNIQITFVDVLYILRTEYDELRLKGAKVTAAMVTSAYRGANEYCFTLLRQTAKIGDRLPPPVTNLLRDTANDEDALICFNISWLNRVGAKGMQKVALLSNCRPLSSFTHPSFLNSKQCLWKKAMCMVHSANEYDPSLQTLLWNQWFQNCTTWNCDRDVYKCSGRGQQWLDWPRRAFFVRKKACKVLAPPRKDHVLQRKHRFFQVKIVSKFIWTRCFTQLKHVLLYIKLYLFCFS